MNSAERCSGRCKVCLRWVSRMAASRRSGTRSPDEQPRATTQDSEGGGLFQDLRRRPARRGVRRPGPWLLAVLVFTAYMLVVRTIGAQNAQRLTFRQAIGTVFPSEAIAPVDRFLAQCPTAAEIASVDEIVSLDFRSDPTAASGAQACRRSDGSGDLTPFQKRVYNAIRLTREIEFDEPLPWTSKPLYEWFADAADSIVFRDEISLSFCCSPNGVINLRTRNLAIGETDRFIDPNLDDGIASFMLLLLHETRHGEGYRHTCGTNADLRLTEMGAWGVQYSLDLWMADHTDPAYFAAPDTDYRGFFRQDARRIVQAYFCLQPTPSA